MAIPNSQAGLFTQVPERVVKSWETGTYLTDSHEPVHESLSSVTHSPIRHVRVEIAFADTRNESSDQVFDWADELQSDRIECWQQTRRFYSDIDAAIESVVAKFTQAMTKEAAASRTRGVETLTRKRTVAFPRKVSTTRLTQHAVEQDKTRAPSTILPSDSITVLADRTRAPKKHKTARSQTTIRGSKHTRATTIASYFANT
jgi:hypothetical protein